MKIIIDDKIPFIRGAFEPVADVQYLAGAKTTALDVKSADALITRTRTKCNEALLKDSRVKYIASATIGYDHIDIDYCAANGLRWSNAPGCNSGAVQQYVLSVIFNLEKKYGFDLENMTVGVIGVGNVGKKVAAAIRALGATVLLNDPPREREEGTGEFTPLQKLLEKSDIICLHTPLTRSGSDVSFHLIDTDELKLFMGGKKSCFLINAGRGEVVNGDALKSALSENACLHATLDVWENEPEIDGDLLDLLDFGSCHTAGYSSDGKANGTTAAVQAVSRFFELGLDDWQATIPDEVDLEFNFNDELTLFENVRNLVLRSFDVKIDDQLLRNGINNFEYLRGSYRIRREPSKYILHGKSCSAFHKFKELVKAISF